MLADARAYATLPVSDLDAARSFYERTLGFTPSEVVPGTVMYHAGEGTTFAVTRSAGKASGDHTQIGLRVTDIDAEVAELRRRGVELVEYDLPGFRTVDGIADVGAGRAAWFRDPEGNLIGMIEMSQA